MPHRAHWQPRDYNALHGGLERWFEPIESAVLDAPAWGALVRALGNIFAAVRPVPRWYVEAHQFRIDTAEGIGRPTPEGAHRDGVDYVAVILVNRNDVSGGETRVFDAHGPAGVRFTMVEPWTALLLDDAQVYEDMRRAQPDWEPRAMPPRVQDALWRGVRSGGRALVRKAMVGVVASRSDSAETIVLKRAERSVTVQGLPAEVALFVYGRTDHSEVDLQGEKADVELLRDTSLGV